jgi:hypothetical protein
MVIIFLGLGSHKKELRDAKGWFAPGWDWGRPQTDLCSFLVGDGINTNLGSCFYYEMFE